MINERVFSITQLVGYIKDKLTGDYFLKNIKVKGEIGNFTNHYSGHWYFTLKDDNALINCTMFKNANYALGFVPKNGDQVILCGSISVFEKSGKMQIIASSMQPFGAGNFYAQFELMRKKLEPLGYFDIKRKKTIPKYPNSVAVITGANTAALQDIRITIAKRWPLIEVKIVPAMVQGVEAPNSIVKALLQADLLGCDVMILARGGGSVDDLWCFNDEKIAHTIYQLKTPIVTGIGHEIDTTIADLVADERCATPTAAAQRVTPDITEVISSIDTNLTILKKYTLDRYYKQIQTLDYFNNKLLSSENIAHKQRNKLQEYQHKLNYVLIQKQARVQKDYKTLSSNFKESSIQFTNTINKRMAKANSDLQLSGNKLFNMLQQQKDAIGKIDLINLQIVVNKLKTSQNQFINQISLLEAVSPLNTLKRGYSIVSQNESIIKSVKDIDYTKEIGIRLSDGTIKAKVLEQES